MLIKAFPGLGPDSTCKSYGDAPSASGSSGTVFDTLAADLQSVLLRTRSLMLIDVLHGGIQRNGSLSEDVIDKWIAQHQSQPFFAFLHLYEPHAPYDAPEPYRSKFKPINRAQSGGLLKTRDLRFVTM